MKVLSSPTWWVPTILAFLHQVIQYGFGLRLKWIDEYLDPLFALPVFLGLWLAERQYIFKLSRLTGLETAVAGSVLALIFEEGFPRLQPAFIRDGYDYLAYAVGGVYFWFFINPGE